MRTSDSDSFFDFGLQLELIEQTFYRRNIKFKDILANLGGVINILFIVGKFLSISYNSFLIQEKILKTSFSDFEKKMENSIIYTSKPIEKRVFLKKKKKIHCLKF